MITRQQVLNMGHGTELWHNSLKNADGTPIRCRVNGKCKVWKTRPTEWQLPVKHGLRDCFYIGVVSNGQWVDRPQNWHLPEDHPSHVQEKGQ